VYRRLIATALASLALLSGCGKADLAIVKPPLVPIYVCPRAVGARALCRHRFDAGKLIGMPFGQAMRVAAAHGYVLLRVAPAPQASILMGRELEVECSTGGASGIVVRILGVT
jgi:hypothetical protein